MYKNEIILGFVFGKSKKSTYEFISWYLDIAKVVATKSKDRSSKVGCVIVSEDNSILSVGYNGFPRGFLFDDDDKYHERPLKYDVTIHAEENAIANAAKNGSSINSSLLFCTHPPCHNCTKLIINSGIEYIIFPKEQDESFIERTKDSLLIANKMCDNLLYRCSFDKVNNKLELSEW